MSLFILSSKLIIFFKRSKGKVSMYNLKKHKVKIMQILMLIYFLFSFQLYAQKDDAYMVKTVVIDAGHGGKDPGAVSKLGKEKDITLSIALKLGNYIEKSFSDVKVVYTRKTDVFVELFKRAEIANKNNADLFISIHINASKKVEPHGFETFVMGIHRSQSNLSVAMLENEAILKEENYEVSYDGFDPKSPEAYIIFSMFQNAFIDQSLTFATLIQDQARDRLKRFDRGVKQDGFLVLWKTAMPSVLIEAGFISNEDEASYLVQDENQDIIASGIFRAFRDYKNVAEGRSSNPKKNVPENKDTLKQEPPKKIETPKIEDKKETEVIDKKSPVDTTNFQKAAENLIQTMPKDTLAVFKLQICSSSVPLVIKPENFKGLNEISEMKFESIYKYYNGQFQSYADAIARLKQVRELYPDAFIVAFKNGKKISISEAIK